MHLNAFISVSMVISRLECGGLFYLDTPLGESQGIYIYISYPTGEFFFATFKYITQLVNISSYPVFILSN